MESTGKWRLVLDPSCEGRVNMATDEAVVSRLPATGGAPLVRIYGWSEPTVSVGYLQDISSFSGRGLPVVRRVTGGRAVLHAREVTYSVVAPTDLPVFSGGIFGAYSAISACILDALKRAGVPAEFTKGRARPAELRRRACFHTPSRFEITAGGRKLVGSSQRRFKRVFLQHGSILYDVEREANEALFGPRVASRMAWAGEFTDTGAEDFVHILAEAFGRGLGVGFGPGGLSAEESEERDRLIKGKYSDPEWWLGPGEGGKAEKRGVGATSSGEILR